MTENSPSPQASRAAYSGIDLVRVATSRRIEADYDERGVFPALRRPPEKAGSSTATEHWCSPTMVEDILSDARVRREQLNGACQAAYTTFIKATEFAVKESQKRLEWLPLGKAITCIARAASVTTGIGLKTWSW